MFADQIRRLFDYNYWANHLILEKIEKLGDAQLRAPSRFPRGSVWETLLHTFDAEWIWRRRIQGKPSLADNRLLMIESSQDLKLLREAWLLEEQFFQGYLPGISDDDLSQIIAYTAKSGPWNGQLSDILMHVVFHGMQHRAELAQMLTEFGHSPGDIDYGIYRGLIGKKPAN